MHPSDSLRRRIVLAFLVFAVVASFIFALLAWVAVEGIEAHLVDHRLQEVAKWAVPRHTGKLPVEMPAGLSFHHGEAIPNSLRNLAPGVQDIHVDGIGLHVLSGADAAGPYVVVDHESDYELVELVVYSLFGAGFLGFLVLSLLLGSFVARRIVSPITALASAVGEGRPDLPLLGARDELGVLSRAFAAHTATLRQVLDRERFFTGDVSHELRSPLTVIMGAAEIVIANSAGKPELQAPAERIYRAAVEAAECVNVLLLLARAPDLGDLPLVDVGQLAAQETARHRGLCEGGKDLVLRFEEGGSFDAATPRELCAAAIGNLIRNACQYTDKGTVTVRLVGRAVIVEDTGPGLPEAVRETLGDTRANVPSAGSAGTGLGLALVQRICDYLGASFSFAERAGGGSVFTISFPPVLTKS